MQNCIDLCQQHSHVLPLGCIGHCFNHCDVHGNVVSEIQDFALLVPQDMLGNPMHR